MSVVLEAPALPDILCDVTQTAGGLPEKILNQAAPPPCAPHPAPRIPPSSFLPHQKTGQADMDFLGIAGLDDGLIGALAQVVLQ